MSGNDNNIEKDGLGGASEQPPFIQPDGSYDECALVGGCLLGERATLSMLVLDYTEPVHCGAVMALRAMSRPVSCEEKDLVHTFFLHVFADPERMLGGWDSHRGPLGPWLTKVAFHQCLKMLRSHEVRWPGMLQANLADQASVPDPCSGSPRPSELLQRLVNHLSERTRDVVLARLGWKPYERPLSVQEIAQRHGMSVAQVYKCVYRIRRHRRRLCEPDDM